MNTIMDALLREMGLPADAQVRAERFLVTWGAVERLLALPLSPRGRMNAGDVLHWSPPDTPSDAPGPVPSLGEKAREVLLDVYHEGGSESEAALCLLVKDAASRAFARTC